MSDASLAQPIHARLEKLEKFTKCKDNTREQILDELHVIKNWLIDNVSVQQHRCLWSYLGYLYNAYGDSYANLKCFVDDLLLKTGHCHVSALTEAIVNGESLLFKKYQTQSLSYNNCGKKLRTIILNDIIEYSMTKWQCDFTLWHSEWVENPELLN